MAPLTSQMLGCGPAAHRHGLWYRLSAMAEELPEIAEMDSIPGKELPLQKGSVVVDSRVVVKALESGAPAERRWQPRSPGVVSAAPSGVADPGEE